MTREELPGETPREDLMREALKHYEELATRACWHRNDIPKAIRAYYASLPPTEGAEEILNKLLGNPGDSINVNSYQIKPLMVDGKAEWWIVHHGVGSGEPLTQWLNEFATLHAQQIADKMVSERCAKCKYRGLPDSINEALNSGDGVYRP